MVNFLFISDEFLSAHSLLGGRGLTESWRRERDRWLVLRERAGAQQPRTVTGYYNLWPCEPSEMRSEAGDVQCAVMGGTVHLYSALHTVQAVMGVTSALTLDSTERNVHIGDQITTQTITAPD